MKALAVCVLSLLLAALPSGGHAALEPAADEFRVDPADEQGIRSGARAVIRHDDGTFVVIWFRTPNPQGIFGQRFSTSGTKMGDPFPVNQNSYAALPMSVAQHASGSFVVVWEGNPAYGYGEGYQNIFAQQFNSAGDRVGDEILAGIFTTGAQTQPDVAALGGGKFVVVWSTTHRNPGDDYDYEIFGQRFAADGSPLGSDFHVNTFTTAGQRNPRVGSAEDGTFVVAWGSGEGYAQHGPDGDYAAVAARRYDAAGQPLGDEFVVNTYTTYSEDSPDLAVGSDGHFVVVWRTQYGDDPPAGTGPGLSDSVTLQRFNAQGAPVGEETHINSYISGAQTAPSIAMNDDGTFVVVWQSGDSYLSYDLRDGDGGIIGRCFQADGTPVGLDSQVNAYTTGGQFNPSVATDGDGRFVVVWEGADSGLSYGYPDSWGIAARRMRCGEGTIVSTLETTKDDEDQLWGEDELVSYTVEAENNGDEPANVTITEVVPVRSVFQPQESTAGWSCTPNNNGGSRCTLNVGELAPGASATATFAVRVEDDTTPLWQLYNSVQASAPTVAVPASGDEVTEYGYCQFLGFDPLICTAICYFMPNWCRSPGGGASQVRAARAPGEPPHGSLLRMRDRILMTTRGGRRLVDLYYQQSANVVAAAISDTTVADRAVEGIAAWLPLVEPFLDGEGAGVTLSQDQVDAATSFLDTLAAAANTELAEVLARERPRLGIDGWVGMNIDEVFAQAEELSCEGYETALFCGELTGDCRITATDALRVLRIAVKIDPEVPESDVNGSGSTTATDALLTLRVAVKVQPVSSDCNIA